jgi:hypothetical protein
MLILTRRARKKINSHKNKKPLTINLVVLIIIATFYYVFRKITHIYCYKSILMESPKYISKLPRSVI